MADDRSALARLAQDFGVEHADVLILASIAGRGGYQALPQKRRLAIAAASRRIWAALGDGAAYTLYQRIRDVMLARRQWAKAA
jgi:uncharacterized protein YtpQ (UPF0354 family)